MDKKESAETSEDARAMAAWNLLILGPYVYACVIWSSSRHVRKPLFRQVLDASAMILVHSGVYAWIHRAMHRVKPLRFVHAYHHRYTTDVTPTVANAVSPWEFLLAYMFPFAIAAVCLKATEPSVFAAAVVVSAFNLCVHSPVLAYDAPWPAFLVHPKEHLGHHQKRGPPYAAPTIAWQRQCNWLSMWMYR